MIYMSKYSGGLTIFLVYNILIILTTTFNCSLAEHDDTDGMYAICIITL